MRKPGPALLTLTAFWTLYAVAAAWALYEATPPLGRDLLLVLAGYGAALAILTGGVLLWVRSSRRRDEAGRG